MGQPHPMPNTNGNHARRDQGVPTAIGRWEGTLTRRSGRTVALINIDLDAAAAIGAIEGDYVELSRCHPTHAAALKPHTTDLGQAPEREPRDPATDARRLDARLEDDAKEQPADPSL